MLRHTLQAHSPGERLQKDPSGGLLGSFKITEHRCCKGMGLGSRQSFRELFWDKWLIFSPCDDLFSDSFTECHGGQRSGGGGGASSRPGPWWEEVGEQGSACLSCSWGRKLLVRAVCEKPHCGGLSPVGWPTIWRAIGSGWKMEKG